MDKKMPNWLQNLLIVVLSCVLIFLMLTGE
jgi:hypothetical protein